MHSTDRNRTGYQTGGRLVAAVASCLFAVTLFSGSVLAQSSETTSPLAGDRPLSPFTLTLDGAPSADDGEAVRLELARPIRLERVGQAILGQAGQSRIDASALSYRIDDRLDLRGGVALGETSPGFLSLGSIHCQNGILDAMSYRAADCTFVDDQAGGQARSIVLGTAFEAGENARASLNLFSENRSYDQLFRPGTATLAAAALLDPFEGGFLSGGAALGSFGAGLAGAQAVESERTGVDLEFQVGFSTDQAGDLVLGLQLTRVLDSGTEGVFYAEPGARNWTIAKPYDTARLSLDWNRGRFSGGVDSYYRSPVNFLDRAPLDSDATFDVHFTWRAPWNASLSVGASNVLGAGADDSEPADGNLADPFESIYGRIPYVRYKQDL